jgi:antitoxin FitA
MAQFSVRNLEEDIKTRLKGRAAKHGWSMEEEVRNILRVAVMEEPAPEALGTRIAKRFSSLRFEGDLPELRGQTVQKLDLEK